MVSLDFGVETRDHSPRNIPVLVALERSSPLPVVEFQNIAEEIVVEETVVQQVYDPAPVSKEHQTAEQRLPLYVGGVVGLHTLDTDNRDPALFEIVAHPLLYRVQEPPPYRHTQSWVILIRCRLGTALLQKELYIFGAHRLCLSDKKDLPALYALYDAIYIHTGPQNGLAIFSSSHLFAFILPSFLA